MAEQLENNLKSIYERVQQLEATLEQFLSKKLVVYKISYDQSVSSGYIGFHGSLETTDPVEAGGPELKRILQTQEAIFRKEGYKVATDIVPKEPKVKIEQ